MVVLNHSKAYYASLDQPKEALARGNGVRHSRAQLRHDLSNGMMRLDDVLKEPEWWLSTMPICELLTWSPRIGSVKRDRILRRADVWPLKEIGKLTLRQRLRLVAVIGEFGWL